MSYARFRQALAKIEQMSDFDSVNGKTMQEVEQAEKELEIKFSRQCKEFYLEYDYSTFEGEEIFGIHGGANAKILEGNIVAYSLNDRKEYGLRKEWIPFYNFGDGSLAYYDYSSLNEFGEPRIIRLYYDGNKYVLIEELAEDFGDFLFELIEYNL